MKKYRNVNRAMLVAGFIVVYLAIAPIARTYPPLVQKAKSMGFAAKDCTFCHINAGGGDPLNSRGNWLVTEKKKRSADSVDVAWLKSYKTSARKKR